MTEEDLARVRRRRRFRTTLAVGSVAILLALGYLVPRVHSILYAPDVPYGGKPPQSFDRQAWIAAEHDWDGHRYLMVDDLLENHSPVGLSRKELEELLGPLKTADEYPWWECYYLGPEPHPWGVDNIWLVPEFEENRVVAVNLLTD